MTIEQRLEKLEKELAMYQRTFVITPTKLTIKQSVLVEGLFNGDRIYTKRSGQFAELTS